MTGALFLFFFLNFKKIEIVKDYLANFEDPENQMFWKFVKK